MLLSQPQCATLCWARLTKTLNRGHAAMAWPQPKSSLALTTTSTATQTRSPCSSGQPHRDIQLNGLLPQTPKSRAAVQPTSHQPPRTALPTGPLPPPARPRRRCNESASKETRWTLAGSPTRTRSEKRLRTLNCSSNAPSLAGSRPRQPPAAKSNDGAPRSLMLHQRPKFGTGTDRSANSSSQDAGRACVQPVPEAMLTLKKIVTAALTSSMRSTAERPEQLKSTVAPPRFIPPRSKGQSCNAPLTKRPVLACWQRGAASLISSTLRISFSGSNTQQVDCLPIQRTVLDWA